MNASPAPVKIILLRLSGVMLVAAALLPLTYLLPPIDLTGALAQASYWIAESGGTRGIPLIGIAMTALVISRAGLSKKQRAANALVIVIALATVLGAGAYLNEHFVKPVFAIPRPNIKELFKSPSADASVVKMSTEEFYAMPNKAARSEYLKNLLTVTPEMAPAMHEHVRHHWIAETGFSFPSGHSFSAMLFATTFLALGLSSFSRHRLWVFFLLVVWAVAVCYSRPILQVHSPTDVCVGGAQGIVGGVLCFLLVRGVLKLVSPERALLSNPRSEI